MQVDEYKKMFLLEDFYWWYRGLHKILLNHFRKYTRKQDVLNILDAGCGTGKVLELFKDYGRITGLDISGDAICFAHTRDIKMHLVQGNAMSLPFSNNAFDCVITLDVLYALEDDNEAAKEFSRVLKKSGLLIANLPAFQWLYSSHDVAVSGRRRYTRGKIVKILSENSFRIEKITYWNAVLFPLEAVIRIINIFLPRKYHESDLKCLPKPINIILTGIVYLEAGLINIFNFPFGLSLFVVARKV